MSGAVTLRKVVDELDNFYYSKENFELMKEAFELQIMEQYIETQIFYYDNSEHLEEMGNVVGIFGDEYFIESANDDEFETFEETFKEKMKTFGGKIKTLWEKLLRVIRDLCNRLLKAGKDLADAVGETTRWLQIGKITEEEAKAVGELIDKASKEAEGSGVTLILNNKATAGRVLVWNAGGVRERVRNLAIGTIYATTKDNNALSINQISNICKAFPNAETMKKRLGQAKGDRKIEIENNIRKFEALQKDLNEMEKKLKNEQGKSEKGEAGAHRDPSVFNEVIAAVSATVKLYAVVEKFKKTVIMGLRDIIKQSQPNKLGADKKANKKGASGDDYKGAAEPEAMNNDE